MTFSNPTFQRGLLTQGSGAGAGRRVPPGTATGGPQPAVCSFCGRVSPDTGVVFTGPGSLVICEHCVEQAHARLGSGDSRTEGRGPDAPARAEGEIAEAFALVAEMTGPDDCDLVHVEAGAGLGTYFRAARSKYEGLETLFVVDHVELLSPTEAEVQFRMTGFMEMPFVGRAVVEAGRWKMARDTLAGLLAGAGVFIPPRAA